MNITSSAFTNNEVVPSLYTCDGKDVSPPLHFENVPAQAKSLALIVDDPDAPRGTWVHWVVWNIDPRTTTVEENKIPRGGVEGVTSFGTRGYGGPCPPGGTHRYFFKLYALDCEVALEANANKAALEVAMQNHILADATLIGLYTRP